MFRHVSGPSRPNLFVLSPVVRPRCDDDDGIVPTAMGGSVSIVLSTAVTRSRGVRGAGSTTLVVEPWLLSPLFNDGSWSWTTWGVCASWVWAELEEPMLHGQYPVGSF